MSSDLIKKLTKIGKEIGWVEKRGRNEHHHYDYATEADIITAIREKLYEEQILIYPQVESLQLTPLDRGYIATITVKYTVTDGSGIVTVTVGAMGHDIPGDKAIYKAMTGAEKYALRQLFLIPTGDDPERDEDASEDSRSNRSADRKPGRRPEAASRAESGDSDTQNSGSRSNPGTPTPDDLRERVKVIPWGKFKGKALAELEEVDLAKYTMNCENAVAKNDPKWANMNKLRLEACKDEWARRYPWRRIWDQVLEAGKKEGLDAEGVEGILKNELGLNAAEDLKEEHLEKFKEALAIHF